MRRSETVLCAILAILAAATGLAPAANGTEFTAEPELTKNPNDRVPLAAVLRFSTDEPVTTTIRVSDGNHRRKLTYGAGRDPEEGLPVVGMRPDRRHTIRVAIRGEDGKSTRYPEKLTFTTPPLPTDVTEFPRIEVGVSRPEKMEPGVTIFNPRRRIPSDTPLEFNQSFSLLVAVDPRGEVVWYYRGDSRISDFKRLRNGDYVFITQDNRLVEIDLLGNVQQQWYAAGRPEGKGEGIAVPTLTFHHSVAELPNGNFLILGTERRVIEDYYGSEWDADAPRRDRLVMGDEVVEFRRDGTVAWRWSAFDHMDPFRIGYLTFGGYWMFRGWPHTADWSHANNVAYVRKDDAVLCNFRRLSAVVKIERPTGDIDWIAGEHSGWSPRLKGKLLKLENADRWFWHQHDARITRRGTLMLFDNNNFEARPFDKPEPPSAIHSKAAEYELDEENRTLRQVWTSEIPGDRQHASIAMGTVQKLPRTGNVLAGYGALLRPEDLEGLTWKTRRRAGQWTQVREYTHTSPPEVVWEMSLHPLEKGSRVGWSCFGTQRLRSVKRRRRER